MAKIASPPNLFWPKPFRRIELYYLNIVTLTKKYSRINYNKLCNNLFGHIDMIDVSLLHHRTLLHICAMI